MIFPKAGLLVFNESYDREDVYRKRKPIAEREINEFISSLSNDIDLIRKTEEIRSKKDACQATKDIMSEDVDLVILYVPVFVSPALVAHTANRLSLPVALVCNEAKDSLSQLAFLAAAGAMDQIGLDYKRIPGDIRNRGNKEDFLCFSRAAAVKNRLHGQTFGCIGGRSLGISSGTADLGLWERKFGVDIDHVDQYEVVRLAEVQDKTKVEKHVDWLKENVKSVDFNDSNFTPLHLEKQVRSYLATRDIIQKNEYDFIGVKCQPELSNGYCIQCINVSLCNDPYDADGEKNTVPCSCEADADGALTMQILKLLSGGKPASLNDIAILTDSEMVLANCGSMASYFAGLSAYPLKNLSSLKLVPHSFGEAGGASTKFTVPEGCEMTFARLFRKKDNYLMGVVTGTSAFRDREEYGPTIQTRPLIFVDMDIDKKLFLQTFGSNHILAVEGFIKQELKALCDLLKIDFYDYDLK